MKTTRNRILFLTIHYLILIMSFLLLLVAITDIFIFLPIYSIISFIPIVYCMIRSVISVRKKEDIKVNLIIIFAFLISEVFLLMTFGFVENIMYGI